MIRFLSLPALLISVLPLYAQSDETETNANIEPIVEEEVSLSEAPQAEEDQETIPSDNNAEPVVISQEPISPIMEQPLRKLSITLSPLHVVIPLLEVTGEYALNAKNGIGLMLGYGQATEDDFDQNSGANLSFNIYEAGLSYRNYIIGDFEHGMQLGAELNYIHIDGDGDFNISGTAAGLSAGPFLGYKIVTDIGFTFDSQLGAQYIVGAAEATDGNTVATTDPQSEWSPLLNLNIGWTF